ncbi:MAG: FMN-binding protein [Lentimicrobiaceae bacterium]|jgi:hypothetical protein|nr:FMN-binding protein [Lentimicrobiaceae bacterium]
MLKLVSIYLIIFSGVIQLGFSAFDDVKIPMKKIEKSVKREFMSSEFKLLPIDGYNNQNPYTKIYQIESINEYHGYVYISRVFSCRSGGCDADRQSSTNDSFEFFDYFLVTNYAGEVLNVKIYNYQATQGHQVMSKGWLKQFVGFKGENTLDYGSDIEAISGATMSASALTKDIQEAEKIIRKLTDNSIQ